VPEVSPPQPSAFARQVTAHREKRNWSKAQLATRLGFDGSYVSHIEIGSKPPTMAFAEKCDSPEVFDLPGTFAELCLASGLGEPDTAAVVDVERDAAGVTVWDMRHITGLLQTEDYARAQLSTSLAPDRTEHEVKARMARQQILGGLLYCWFIIDEAALHRGHGGQEVMRGQLAHLEEVAALPNITVQVLPFSDDSRPGGDAPITIVEYRDKPTVWLTEGRASGRISDNHAEVIEATLVLNQLRATALSPRESVEFIRKAREARNGLA
jgi:transcriptional regulator with XRE-family HTH domain